jgi:hypothetical protein
MKLAKDFAVASEIDSFGHLCLSWLEIDGVCSERGRKNC